VSSPSLAYYRPALLVPCPENPDDMPTGAQRSSKNPHSAVEDQLSNSDISELLAVASEGARQPLQKALRRAARKSLLWTDEAWHLHDGGRSLTELPGVGPYLEKVIRGWLDSPPSLPARPETRQNFLTWTQTQAIVQKRTSWPSTLKGDLQMHTLWSDGSGSIQEMAEAADLLGYEYIAITDHSQGLKIAGGIDEEQLEQQRAEITEVNESLSQAGRGIRVIHSIELNLRPYGRRRYEQEIAGPTRLGIGLFSFRTA
jgi:PHP domain